MYIVKSVGLGGKNQKSDVAFVQDLLNVIGEEDVRFPRLVVDGRYGNNTKKAIGLFQVHHVKLRQLDYRIDPNGRSEKTLIAKNIEIDNSIVPSAAQKHGLKREKQAISSGGSRNINYRSNAKKVVSVYSENIIKLAMGYAGINKCDISSTLRSIDDQVRIMYGNILRFPAASSVSSLKSLRKWGYAAPGRAVETVYFEKKKSGEAEIKKAMKGKVEALAKEGKRVSLHCVPESVYKKNNIVDIPFSSVIANKRKDFEIALMGMTEASKIKNRRYASPVQGEVYISRLIIEDKCWHIEVPQNNKILPNQKKPAAPAKKKNLKYDFGKFKQCQNYFFNFLDDWY